MKHAKKLSQRSATELVQSGHRLLVYPSAPNSCRVTPISRLDGATGTPINVNNATGFVSDTLADADQAFRIEALTDRTVYYAVVSGAAPGLIYDESHPPVPLED